MEWIGFIALVLFGGYLVFGGIVMEVVSSGFTGNFCYFGFIIAAFGLGILYLAWIFKPFEILIN